MIEMTLLRYKEAGVNALGQKIHDFVEDESIEGWLDMLSGNETDRATALSTSSHVFITPNTLITVKNTDRLRYGKQLFEVTYVDNPVNLNHHFEIYLKVVS